MTNRRWNCFVTLVVLLTGCSSPKAPPVGDPDLKRLTVAAASDLQTVLPEVADLYQQSHPEWKVVLTFGASGQLAVQVKEGAPFDLFLSANKAFVTELASNQLVLPDSIRPYALGSLVLAVQKDAAAKREVKGIEDLTSPDFKAIAIANPDTAPYGAAAKQALQRAGLWERVERKLVFAENVRQALQFVEAGNAEIGFVSLATTEKANVLVVPVDPKLHEPIVQALGIVTGSKHPKEAEDFATFLTTGPGSSILDKHGFKRPPGARE